MAKYTYKFSDEIVAVSEGVADDLSKVIGIERGKIEVIYNPVVSKELIQKSNEPVNHPWFLSDTPVILSVGNLRPQKNFGLLLKSFKSLLREEDAKLIIAGEGPQREYLEKQVQNLNLDDDVELPGYVENVYSYMSCADLFTLSSNREGLPTVLIEALACGCPVVSTDCPSGPREVLKNGKYGKLVPVGDSYQLTKAMKSSLANNHDTQKLMNVAKRYSTEKAYDNYESLFFNHEL